MADISCNLPLPLLKRLEEEKKVDKYNPKSVTTIIHEALAMYFLRKDMERGLPRTEVMVRNQPLAVSECIPPDRLNVEQPPEDSGFLHKGLIIPETGYLTGGRRRRELSPIEPGDTAMRKLKERGIEPADVIKAKRNWRAGREYNTELEKYFNLI